MTRHPATLLFALLLASPVFANWADNTWPYRRALDVDWPANRAPQEDLATADVFTAGHHAPSGENIRVATEEGKYLPCHVLMIGPGDRMRIVFSPLAGVRRYYVYFGRANPPPPQRGTEDVAYHCGVLLSMHTLRGGLANDFRDVEPIWQRSMQPIGQLLLDHLSAGFNPFGDQSPVVSRYTASLIAPEDGKYTFAISAGDRAALYIDGKPILFAAGQTGNTRFNATVDLKHGRHDLLLYQFNRTGDLRMNVVWKRPGANNYEQIPPQAFGVPHRATAGPMEEFGKMFIADFRIEYIGEAFYFDHYTHRYKFTAQPAKVPANAQPKYEWDFGDGQTASTPSVDHVFLTDGEFSVKLSIKAGMQSDVQANRLSVSRLYEHIDNPPTDSLKDQARIVAEYDVAAMSPRYLAWATLMFQRATLPESLEKTALRLATDHNGVDPGFAASTLERATDELSSAGHLDSAAKILASVPASSPLQPMVAQRYAHLLLWRMADFPTAIKMLETMCKAFPSDNALKRSYAQALILNQETKEGKKLLESIPSDSPERHAALAGALARSIEYYITEKDWEPGQQTWEKWQQQYPADFVEGYSIMLQTRLMEIAGYAPAAAKVAESFALAVPKSSYAPQLLDRASKLLAKSDPGKSAAIRNLLKQKYPEDPLSQDNPKPR